MDSKYLVFVLKLRPAKKKTDTWQVYNKESDTLLGTVKWYGSWRKYCFFVEGSFVFEEICLNDISAFIKEQTKLYKAAKKEAK